jgi:hypothetical protein
VCCFVVVVVVVFWWDGVGGWVFDGWETRHFAPFLAHGYALLGMDL